MLFDTAAKLSQYFSFPVFEASSAKRQSLPETSHNNMTEHRHTSRARSRTRSRYLLDTAECDTQWTTAGWPRYSLDDHPLLPTNLAKRGYHKFTCFHVPFHVKKQYNFIRELGVGAYGCVALAYDAERNMNVAIKKLANVFSRETITRRALREVSALEHLRGVLILSSCLNLMLHSLNLVNCTWCCQLTMRISNKLFHHINTSQRRT